MTGLKRCILIVGLALLLPGTAGSAQGIGDGWQAQTSAVDGGRRRRFGVHDRAVNVLEGETDLVVAKSDDPDPVVAGEVLTYTLVITNSGPSGATGVVVTDTLPSGVSFDSAVASQGTYNSVTGEWMVGELADGSDATLTLVLTVDPSTRGTLSNTAEVSAIESDPTPGNNTTTVGTMVNAEADLVVAKSDDPDPVVAGEVLTYTLVITNSGPSDATGVVVTDTLPSGASFDSAVASQGTYDSITGEWIVGELADGSDATLTLVLTVDPSTRGMLFNAAEVSAIESDPVPLNNTTTVGTVVNAEADLVVAKSDGPDPVVAGEALTYSLTLTNSGPSDATGITIVDDFPDKVALFSATPSQGTCSGVDALTCNIGAVASGASATVSLVVTVTSPLPNGTIITNVAATNGNETDPHSGNNSAQTQTAVQSSPVLTITKTDDPDPVDAGGTLLYTLVVTNSGNENATSVSVSEHYDPNVSFVYANPGPDPGSGNQVWTLPTVAVGSPETIDIVVRVTSPLPVGAILTNRATLDSDQTAPVTVTTVTSVTSAADLTLTKVDLPDPVQAGGDLVYFVTYQNFGTAPAEDVVITETYDSRTTFVSAEPVPREGTNNVWDIGGVPVGESGSILVTVRVDTPLTNGSVLNNRVTMDGAHTAPQSITETTRVASAPDLTLSVSGHLDPVEAGDPLTYTLRYANAGNADATQVVVTATLDSRVSLANAMPPPDGGSDQVWYWNVDTISGGAGYGETVIRVDVPFSLPNGTILEFTAQLKDAEGDFLECATQTTVRTLPDLTIAKMGQGHVPSLFSPNKQMAYIVTYGNAGYGDAQDVIITATLPTGTTYGGYEWQPSGDGVYTYAIGPLPARSTGHTITFTVMHPDTPGVSALEFSTPFAIAARAGTGEDLNPDDNMISIDIGVPDLTIEGLSIEPDPASVQPGVLITFTVTVTLMNQGTGMAWNPDDASGFFVDVFTASIPSYPFDRDGEFSAKVGAIAPGFKSPPSVITVPLTTPINRDVVFYIKVDNHERYPYGLVPEHDEMNNVIAWPPRVFLPCVLKRYRTWDTYYEDNDHWRKAYGPLASGQTYLAYPDDAEDYYYFTLPATATVSVTVTDFAPTSSNGTVALYGPAVGDNRGDYIVHYGDDGRRSMHLEKSLAPGKYYIRVYTAQEHSTQQLYRLTMAY
jgi:uncharacterized repeat protein (TIGR01451 family)